MGFCEPKTTPDDGIARVFWDIEAVVDIFAAEYFKGLLEGFGARAGEA